jgi:hypothetical protein
LCLQRPLQGVPGPVQPIRVPPASQPHSPVEQCHQVSALGQLGSTRLGETGRQLTELTPNRPGAISDATQPNRLPR